MMRPVFASSIGLPQRIVAAGGGGSPSTPTFVQHVMFGGGPGNADSMQDISLPLPNPTLANNCLIVDLRYHAAATVSSITDNIGGNTYTLGPTIDDTQVVGLRGRARIYYALGVAAGVTEITVHFGAAGIFGFHAEITEFAGIATSSAADGNTASNSTSAPNVDAGSFTPSTAGCLIYSFTVGGSDKGDELQLFAPLTGCTPGSGFTLLSVSRCYGFASQWRILPTATSITPAITMAGVTDPFSSVALALKAGTAGTLPAAGKIRIRAIHHQDFWVTDGSAQAFNFPTGGNLIVVGSTFGGAHVPIGTTTDNKSNSYTFKTGADVNDTQIQYAPAATPGQDMVVTIHPNGPIGNFHFVTWDVENGHASAFDTDAYNNGSASATPVPLTFDHMPDITPVHANGLVLFLAAAGHGPFDACTPGQFAFEHYVGENDDSKLDFGDGCQHVYNATTAAINAGWTITANSNPSEGFHGGAWAFRGA